MQLIYRLTSPTGRVYIGQTKNERARLACYRTLKCKTQARLYRSLVKHGFDSHAYYVIHRFPEMVSQAIVDNYEKYCIAFHKHALRLPLLNLTEGGRGNGHRGPQPKDMKRPDMQGERNHLAKLTASDVMDMRALYKKGVRGRGIRQLATKYNVSQRLVYNVVNLKTWKHVEQTVPEKPLLLAEMESQVRTNVENNMRRLYGPKPIRRPQCGSMLSDRPNTRCDRQSKASLDVCGLHALEHRELQREINIKSPHARNSAGQYC